MRLLAISIATIALLAAPAAAQRTFDPDRVDRSQIGSRFKIAEEAVGQSDMRRMQKKMMRCTASTDRDLSSELLQKSDPVIIAYDDLSVPYDEMLDDMKFGTCLGRAMPPSARMMRINFQPSVFRNLLAEEIYLFENKKPLTIGENDPEFLENRFFVGGRRTARSEFPARLADCIVYRAPEGAHDFVKARPSSSKEREAVEALTPVVDSCLPQEYDGFELSLSQLRAFVADGLWSRSYYSTLPTGEVAIEAEVSE